MPTMNNNVNTLPNEASYGMETALVPMHSDVDYGGGVRCGGNGVAVLNNYN